MRVIHQLLPITETQEMRQSHMNVRSNHQNARQVSKWSNIAINRGEGGGGRDGCGDGDMQTLRKH